MMKYLNCFLIFGVACIINWSSCLTIRNEGSKNNKQNLKNSTKNKKSVETLYTIENDLNPGHQYGDGYQYYVPEKYIPTHSNHHSLLQPEDISLKHHLKQEQVYSPHHLHATIDTSKYLAQQEHALRVGLAANPLLAAVVLSQTLHVSPLGAATGFNHAAHLPINPYVALLLSHYGRYIQPAAFSRHQRGIYGYAAANNLHNNKPFGAYKIHEDAK